MIFKVQSRRHNIPTKSIDPTVILVQDSWDDYGYKTTFGATVITDAGALELGSVKILRADQQGGLTPIDNEFTALSEEYCSLGQTQSYYELLRSLGDDIRKSVLTGLRDAATNPTILTDFEHLEGFKNSLIRSSVAERVLIDIPVFSRTPSDRMNPMSTSKLDLSLQWEEIVFRSTWSLLAVGKYQAGSQY